MDNAEKVRRIIGRISELRKKKIDAEFALTATYEANRAAQRDIREAMEELDSCQRQLVELLPAVSDDPPRRGREFI